MFKNTDFQRHLKQFSRWSHEHKLAAIAISLAAASVVAVVDFLTGDNLPLVVCYLPSFLMMCWVAPPMWAYNMAAICSGLWMVDDLLVLERSHINPENIWIGSIHFIFFSVIAGMVFRLRAAHERERLYARTDALTELANSKAFHGVAAQELARCKRTGGQLAVAFIDCDNFKTVNDTLGHQTGDDLLKAIADTMKTHIRSMDTAARMGGDEFALLLPDATVEEAELVVNRLREKLLERMQQGGWPVTFSIGVAIYQTLPNTIDDMIHAADVLMYEVKQNTKDAAVFKLVA